eukprot:CAMPEP_0113400438 /NCGR_PEP_ID=MMETSP0013_2-20120614/16125_1 /TAXON_ID=2843 ORGANISM="Skeletonema costatum, Strain 1716" /NCGR_SAMPLE_ID=MMETSP0013_2 /ASSEMBLY_ACC=CAM_ASM_000158 /LENGTH=84 /DNA_ID=CAMNT_0000285511 /DNA_START=495 /DNA_END=749 /DNA_ORIENTATION=+ /assembly_acc=CAM_ASM_000158
MTTHPVKVVMNDAFSTLDDFVDSLDESEGRSSGDKSNLLQQHFDCIYHLDQDNHPMLPIWGLFWIQYDILPKYPFWECAWVIKH